MLACAPGRASTPSPTGRRWRWRSSANAVNLMILWDEYRTVHPDGNAYSRFCQLFREFDRRLSPTMRQQHVAGHKLFVDYPGKRVPIADPLRMPRRRRVS
jgi:transposase